jgi:hypothetical protein
MAVVRKFEIGDSANVKPQGEVLARARLVESRGEKYVQIDTFGSPDRQEVGKQSQTIRLSKAAFDQLVRLGSDYF